MKLKIIMSFVGTLLCGLGANSMEAAFRNGYTGVAEFTADDQALTKSDAELTAKIRRDLTSNNQLSVDAKNIKIISQNGKVTLNGRVDKAWEKNWIEQQASIEAGPMNITSNLTIEK